MPHPRKECSLAGRIGIELLIVLGLVLINGVLAMSELAVVSSRRARLQQRAEAGSTGAQVALRLVEQPTRFLSTVQIGITLVGILAGAISGATLAKSVSELLADIPAIDQWSDPLGVALVVMLITFLSLVLGELVPKRLAMRNPEGVAATVARPMQILSQVTRPVVALLTFTTDGILRLLGVRHTDEAPVTEEEIRILLGQSAEAGVIAHQEEEFVGHIFELGDRRAGELMTPRHRVDYIDLAEPPAIHHQVLTASRHSTLPVVEDSLDNVVGVVSLTDLWEQAGNAQPLDVRSAMREALFVPEVALVFQVLESFRLRHPAFAIVVDEYGSPVGVLTPTDVLEAIVGEVADPPHPDDPRLIQRDDGSWLVDGQLDVDLFRDTLDTGILPGEQEGLFQTVGGFVMTQLGRVPQPTDSVAWGNLRFEVMDMDGTRVDKILVTRSGPEA